MGSLFRLTEAPYLKSKVTLTDVAELQEKVQNLDLSNPEFRWYKSLKAAKKPVDPKKIKPWVIVVMGTPAIGKTFFMNNATEKDWRKINKSLSDSLGRDVTVPFNNLFFKQLDDIVSQGAQNEFRQLYNAVHDIPCPHERFRTYWANKQMIFTRWALDSVGGGKRSYEFEVGE